MNKCDPITLAQCPHGAYCEPFAVYTDSSECAKLNKAIAHELKPCPFCGGKASVLPAVTVFEGIPNRYFVTCALCGVETPRTSRTRTQAENAWNRRTEDAE